MGWIPNWLRRADVRLRPRAGAQVDLQPLSERSGRWLKANLFRFPGAVWSRKRGCVELSEGDVIALHLVVERITEAGLRCGCRGAFAAGTVRRLFGLCWCAGASGYGVLLKERGQTYCPPRPQIRSVQPERSEKGQLVSEEERTSDE